MIIVVSDVHLAQHPDDPDVKRDDQAFEDFLKHIACDQLRDGGHLVLLGDIVDFWRRDFAKALTETAEIFSMLTSFNNSVKVHYVAGNHDFFMLRLYERQTPKFPFAEVSRSLSLQDGGSKFFFIHGYQLEVLANPFYKSLTSYESFSENLCLYGDDTGNAASRLWDAFQTSKSLLGGLVRLPVDISASLKSMMKSPEERLEGAHKAKSSIDRLAASRARTLYIGAERDEVLVYGHTHDHDSAYDAACRVVNTGSWKKSPCEEYRFLEIKDGRVAAKAFR
jgi:UDP-2,3-diacylglucosamine pyrophosphatase LpxH